MKQQFLVFVECVPGRTYQVAQDLMAVDGDLISAYYSISGEWDLLLRAEFDAGRDFGDAVGRLLREVEGITRTSTSLGYPSWDPSDVYFDEDGD